MYQEYTQIGLTPNRSNIGIETVNFPLKLSWKTELLDNLVHTPLISNNKIYIEATSSKKMLKESYFILDAETGKQLSEYNFERGDLSVKVNEYCLFDGIFITCTYNDLVAIKDEKIIWRIDKMGGSIHYPIIYKDTLIIARDGVYMIDPLRGAVKKKIDIEKAGAVACFEDKMVFGDVIGNMFCFDFETGKKLWGRSLLKIGEFKIDYLKGTEIKQGKMYSRFPLIANGKVFLTMIRFVCCFDINTGELMWKTDLWETKPGSNIREVIFKNGRLYGFDGEYLFCIDADTGQIIYRKGGCKKAQPMPPLPFISGNTFFGASIGVYAFDIISGDLLWEFYGRKGFPFRAQPVFINGRLYAGCSDGYLYCFESKKR